MTNTQRMSYEQAYELATRTWSGVHSVERLDIGAWKVRLYAPNGPVHALPDGDSGIPAAHAWTDDLTYGPQQVIPAGLDKRCGPRCGFLRPVPGTDHFDADGTATIDTRCDGCHRESSAHWYWPVGAPPAEDPGYLAGEQDEQPTVPTVPSDNPADPYAGRPMRGWFLVLMRRADGLSISTSIRADTVADLNAQSHQYADRYGLTVCSATYAGHPVPGFAGEQDAQPPTAADHHPHTATTKGTTVNLEATGPEEIRAAFSQAIDAAGEQSEEIAGVAGVLGEAADRYESLEMAASTVGHLRDAAEAYTAAAASLSTAMEELQAALADFNTKDGAVAEAAAEAGNLASKEVLVG